MSPFSQKVLTIVASVPYQRVASYGQVAAYCGLPRAARQVGWILHATERSTIDLPWWRIINNKGYLSIRGNLEHDKNLQKKLLEAEGIPVSEDYLLPIEEYRFRPTAEQLKAFELPAAYIDQLIAKYGL